MITADQLWRSVSLSEPVFQHADHHFVINHGLKVMHHDESGEIHMRNTRIGGDFYGPVTDEQAMWVFTYGFDIGARLIAIATIVHIIEKINVAIQNSNANSVDRQRERRSNLLKQIHEKTNDLQRERLDNDTSQKLQALIGDIIAGKRGTFSVSNNEPELAEG